MKTKILVMIAIIFIMLVEYLILDFTFQPKIKFKEKIKIKEKIKKVDPNLYFIYEDKMQVVGLSIFNNKYASIEVVDKDINTPLSIIFKSHDFTQLYLVEEYKTKYYIKGDLNVIYEFQKNEDELICDEIKFEKTDLRNLYEKINKATLQRNNVYNSYD
jgi:hypothetical protein